MEQTKTASEITVGIFDSGIGGLNLLSECVKTMGGVNFIYFADNRGVPYGLKSREEIFSRVCASFDLMAKTGCCAAVAACNTVTALCIKDLRARYPFPIVGIQPAVKQAVNVNGKCVVLATEATAKSESLKELIARFGDGRTEAVACKNLASLIEKHAPDFEREEIISALPNVEADSVVLGCTHYAFIKKAIRNKYGCPVFDGMVGTADHLRTLLGINDHLLKNSGKIAFVGGEINKNFAIFKHLMKSVNR